MMLDRSATKSAGRGHLRKVTLTWVAGICLGSLTACSSGQSDDEIAVPESATGMTEEQTGPVLFRGGGLKGLPKLSASAKLPNAEMLRLFSIAYGGREPGRFTETFEDEVFSVTPAFAVRVPGRSILFVDHAAAMDCHACSGFTSVFYFDEQGQTLTDRFPRVLSGTGWGSAGQNDLVRLSEDDIKIVTAAGGTWQGISCTFAGIYNLGERGPTLVGTITTGFDDAGAGGATDWELEGAEANASGDQLTLRYSGRRVGETGATEPIDETKQMTLDGIEDPWHAAGEFGC